MTKKTFASITEELCKCGFLEREANDPDSPIIFDKELNEYRIEYTHRSSGEIGQLLIYHCSFCGGGSPESLRDELFARITDAERNRLIELTQDIKTLENAIAKFGPADFDRPNGVTFEKPESGTEAPTIQSFRTLIFQNLSDTADVHIIDSLRDRVHIMFQGKYISSLKESE